MAWYNKGKTLILDGSLSLLSDTIKVMLVTSSYSFNADDHFANTPAANELSGTGYAGGFAGSGRKTLASKAVTENDTSDRAEFDAADVTWTAISAGTAAAVILLKEITNDAASPIIAYIAFTAVVTNGGDLTLQWDATGILQLS